MEISKDLSFGTGQTESACMDERASGNWLTMKIVKNALNQNTLPFPFLLFFQFSKMSSICFATTLEKRLVAADILVLCGMQLELLRAIF